jgi:hypothetical protein
VDVIAGIVDANGAYLRGLIREVAEDVLGSSGVRDRLAAIAEQRSRNLGQEGQDPIDLTGGGSVPVTAADVRGRTRPAGSSERTQMGSGAGTANVDQRQTYSDKPGHIEVEFPGGGSYGTLAPDYQIWQPNAQQLASDLISCQNSGRLTSGLGNTPENIARVARLSRLAGVEAGRDRADLVRRAMLLDLAQRGIPAGGQALTTPDLIQNRNLMAPGKTVATAHETARQSSSNVPDAYKRKPSRAKVAAFIARERDLMVTWLYGRMTGTDPLFSAKDDLRTFIRKQLGDYLRRLLSEHHGV